MSISSDLAGEHDDRHRLALGAQPPADLEAVHARQHHVEHDEIEDLLVEARQRLGAVCRLHDLVSVALEREGQERLDRLLVVDEKDSGGSVCHDLLQKQDSWGLGALTSTEVLDARVYRTAFLPALVALFVAAFALAGSARPCAQRAARRRVRRGPRVRQRRDARAAVAERPREGLPGPHRGVRRTTTRMADLVEQVFKAPEETGAARAVHRPARVTPSRTGDLTTVIATRPGQSERRIVAARPPRRPPAWRTCPAPRRCSSSRACSSRASCARRSCSSPPRAPRPASRARARGPSSRPAGRSTA